LVRTTAVTTSIEKTEHSQVHKGKKYDKHFSKIQSPNKFTQGEQMVTNNKMHGKNTVTLLNVSGCREIRITGSREANWGGAVFG
jgi:hypothetical protein